MSNQYDKDPLYKYRHLLRSIDHFFSQSTLFLPPIPIRIDEQKDTFIIYAELPGIEKEQIQLDVYRQALRIRVHHKEEQIVHDENERVTKQQMSSQVRERYVPLPFLVDERQVHATYKNGLLRITIPYNKKKIYIE